jgi:hypothetical protein
MCCYKQSQFLINKINNMNWRFNKKEPQSEVDVMPQVSRRKFLGVAGLASGVIAITAQSCDKDDDDDGVSFGSDVNVAILNYAYALEQLEAAFYTRVMQSPYASMPVAESNYLSDIMKHEIAHREFFKNALGSNALPGLDVDFSSIDFTSRTSVLGAAKIFEDTGVGAYNGAGRYLTNVDYLGLAGKIVSVEARHAAIIRNLVTPNSFADDSILEATSRRDVAYKPRDVLNMVSPFVRTKLNANTLPS